MPIDGNNWKKDHKFPGLRQIASERKKGKPLRHNVGLDGFW